MVHPSKRKRSEHPPLQSLAALSNNRPREYQSFADFTKSIRDAAIKGCGKMYSNHVNENGGKCKRGQIRRGHGIRGHSLGHLSGQNSVTGCGSRQDRGDLGPIHRRPGVCVESGPGKQRAFKPSLPVNSCSLAVSERKTEIILLNVVACASSSSPTTSSSSASTSCQPLLAFFCHFRLR
jgi:hypothetical protein